LKFKYADRVINEAHYIVETRKTLREIAKVFGVSKSTVHKDLKDRLEIIDKKLHNEVLKVLLEHKETRHLRGGESTRKKYLKYH